MKVRITQTPLETELNGVRLDVLRAGMIRDVSPILGSWLIMQGYAQSEMRGADRLSEMREDGISATRHEGCRRG